MRRHHKAEVAEVAVAAAATAPHAVAAVEVAAVAGVAAGVRAAEVAAERRHFHIVNEANGSVLTVHRGDPKPGVQIHVDKPRPDRAPHQIWYFDLEGVIRCKLNDFAIHGKESGEQVRLSPFTGDARQQWIFQGNKIINRVFCDECLGLRKHLRLKEDADVIGSPYEGKPFQHWRIEPIVL